jgi:hypothetical protein
MIHMMASGRKRANWRGVRIGAVRISRNRA